MNALVCLQTTIMIMEMIASAHWADARESVRHVAEQALLLVLDRLLLLLERLLSTLVKESMRENTMGV